MAVGVIAPISKGSGDSKTLYGSLLAEGYHRAPGASLFLTPKMEKDGRFRTGLDDKASYIDELPLEEQEIERKRVSAWRSRCEEYFRVELGATSKFYTDMFIAGSSDTVLPLFSLSAKEEMVFDLDNPEQLVIFAYLRVHEDYIAPSYDAYYLGMVKDPTKIQFYVKDEQTEMIRTFNKNSEMNKAIAFLENSNDSKKRSIARCLNLGVNNNTSPEMVYNLLNSFIKQGVLEEGYFKGKKSIDLFNQYMSMKEETLNIYDLVKRALDYNVLRTDSVSKHIYKGGVKVGENIEMVAAYLVGEEGQDMYAILKVEVEQKEGMTSKFKKSKVK